MAFPANDTTRTKMAALPELIQLVLLHLPLRDALLAQRVSHTWRNTIKDSVQLQRALFFSPSVDHALTIPGLSEYRNMACDCIRARRPKAPAILHLHYLRDIKSHRWARDEADLNEYTVAINPFVTKGTCLYVDIEEGIEAHIRGSIPRSSLRSMLLTQPPVDLIIVSFDKDVHVIPRQTGAVGVTVADFMDAVPMKYSYFFMNVWRTLEFERYDVDSTSAKEVLRCQNGYIRGQMDVVPERSPPFDYSLDDYDNSDGHGVLDHGLNNGYSMEDLLWW